MAPDLAPFWLMLGRVYRRIVQKITGLSAHQNIGPYGPFRMLPEFAFSDFESWGSAHNKGFRSCVDVCRGRNCVLDVGAHIGLVALPMASVISPGGRVWAFEPAQANARILRRHLEMNSAHNIEVTQALVGAANAAEVGFYESVGPHGQNAIILKSEKTLVSEHGGYSRTMRRQVALDAFCGERNLVPEVIKIDVEGAELGVLRGARKILIKHRPIVYLSVHPREIELVGHSLEELTALVAELGYELLTIDGARARELKLDEYLMAPVDQGGNT